MHANIALSLECSGGFRGISEGAAASPFPNRGVVATNTAYRRTRSYATVCPLPFNQPTHFPNPGSTTVWMPSLLCCHGGIQCYIGWQRIIIYNGSMLSFHSSSRSETLSFKDINSDVNDININNMDYWTTSNSSLILVTVFIYRPLHAAS